MRQGKVPRDWRTMSETHYKTFFWKQTVQHYMSLLAPWMNGHTEREIAEHFRMTEDEVRRDLKCALRLIEQRKGLSFKTHVVEDQMPATVCWRCEGAIPHREYRV